MGYAKNTTEFKAKIGDVSEAEAQLARRHVFNAMEQIRLAERCIGGVSLPLLEGVGTIYGNLRAAEIILNDHRPPIG